MRGAVFGRELHPAVIRVRVRLDDDGHAEMDTIFARLPDTPEQEDRPDGTSEAWNVDSMRRVSHYANESDFMKTYLTFCAICEAAKDCEALILEAFGQTHPQW